jgi:hypothetical protein
MQTNKILKRCSLGHCFAVWSVTVICKRKINSEKNLNRLPSLSLFASLYVVLLARTENN